VRHRRGGMSAPIEKSTTRVDLRQAQPPSCKSPAGAAQQLAKEIER